MRFILALDQGTTSSRAILFDHDGHIAGVAQRELRQIFPRGGWVEHDPLEIWESQRAVAVEVMQGKGLTAGDIAGIGITNQRETTVVWDRATGEPIHNAIVWQDRRTAEFCDGLKRDGLEPLFQERTGLVIDPYFSGTKLRWILDHVEGARERAERGELAFGTVDSWLVWRLTGGRVHVTDTTNASRTMLCDLRTGDWDEELLAALKIPRAVLPRIISSSEICGEVSGEPLLAGVPIAGIAGDQHAALFGQACFEPGMAKNTYGTGCFVLLNTGDTPTASSNRLITTAAWNLGGRTSYALEGSIFIAGAVVQWLRDGLGVIAASGDVEQLAESVPDNGGVYFVPAFAGLGAPHWDAYARGAAFGITRGTTGGHLARAALESIAFQTADVLDAMRADSGIDLAELRVDGGACANDLLMQFQSDVLQAPVVRPKVTETTALGAAYLAGLATGFWRGREEISGQWSVERRFEPKRGAEEVAELRGWWARAVERTSGWAR